MKDPDPFRIEWRFQKTLSLVFVLLLALGFYALVDGTEQESTQVEQAKQKEKKPETLGKTIPWW